MFFGHFFVESLTSAQVPATLRHQMFTPASPVHLSEAFYRRPALRVARALLGQVLVHDLGDRRLSARIVETEAYIGPQDLACHAAKGRTARSEVLFGPPGIAYVFLIYGMHHCFNTVTGREGLGAAVLVRGAEPLEGLAPSTRLDGPGRLCRGLEISMRQNRTSLLEAGPLWIEARPPVPAKQVVRGPRIGVDYAGPWAAKPYRLWVRGSSGVSRPR
jgi:DNA-3-methyladenine glycosylase